jgi:hypothetical protein
MAVCCLAFVLWKHNALGENYCWFSAYSSYVKYDKANMAKLSDFFEIFTA